MMRMVGEIAFAISSSLALSLIVKATVIAAGALIAAHIARRSRASVRHVLLAAAFMLLLALPLVSVAAPPREVNVLVPQAGSTVRVAALAPLRPAVPDSRSVENGGMRAGTVTRTLPSVSGLLLAVWVMGVALVLLPMIAGLMRVRRVRQNGLPWQEGQAVVAEIATARAVRIRTQLLLDAMVVGPMTCGVFRPVIVLPQDVRVWDPEDLQRAIVHELEHIRRRDWLMMLIARVVCALYWFHPLVWLSWRQLRLEAERACDDAVLLGAHPEVYANQLVTLAERLASDRAESALAMANRSDLCARVSAVLDHRQPRGRAGSLWIATVSAVALLLLAGIAPLRAVAVPQAGVDASSLLFEVASVKPNRSGATDVRWTFANGRFTAVNVTLKALMSSAYGSPQQPLPDFQISGGPSWLDSARFDVLAQVPVEAVADNRTTMTASTLGMLRRLLEERFQLRTHFESREQPIYELVLSDKNGRPGPQLRRRTVDCPAIATGTATGEPCGGQIVPGRVSARGVSIPQLVSGLARLMPNVGRLVVDRTGLTGTYDLDLTWTPDQLPSADRNTMPIPTAPIDPNGPSLFTALQEQLGLKLDSTRGLVPVLMIDSVGLPTED